MNRSAATTVGDFVFQVKMHREKNNRKEDIYCISPPSACRPLTEQKKKKGAKSIWRGGPVQLCTCSNPTTPFSPPRPQRGALVTDAAAGAVHKFSSPPGRFLTLSLLRGAPWLRTFPISSVSSTTPATRPRNELLLNRGPSSYHLSDTDFVSSDVVAECFQFSRRMDKEGKKF